MSAVPAFLQAVVEGFDDVVWEESHGQNVVRIASEGWFDFAAALKEAGFEVCSDVTVVDRIRPREQRFEVVVNLLSMEHVSRIRILTTVSSSEPRVASLVPIWPGANFAEREAYDMFGVEFDGHPDLTRILMPDEWEGHPLRKDYGLGSVPVQFKESHQVS